MATIHSSVLGTIGSTPLVQMNKLAQGGATILAKLESRNPLASVKDRIGAAMIEAAELDGRITAYCDEDAFLAVSGIASYLTESACEVCAPYRAALGAADALMIASRTAA